MSNPSEDRLTRISAKPKPQNYNAGYSKFIKRVQLILPIGAFLLIGLIFGWNQFQTNTIQPVTQTYTQDQKISRNELINPKFDSIDDKGQPYTITASRAVQDAADKETMFLENPTGNVALENDETLAIRAKAGTYKQGVQTINLRDSVIIKHSLGYTMNTEKLDVDMTTSTATSDQDVNGDGPEGTIEAKGIEASSSTNTVIFHGPAKLVLTQDSNANILNLSGGKQ